MQFFIPTIALLSGFVSAAPHLAPRGLSSTFQLLFTAEGDIPDEVAALRQGRWSVGIQDNDMYLFPTNTKAALFYAYGVEHYIASADTGIVLTPGGTATIPAGWPIDVVENNATAGVEIIKLGDGLPLLTDRKGGRFMACAGDDDQIFLSYIASGQRPLAACAVANIVSKCSGNGSGEDQVGELGEPFDVYCQPH